MSWYYCYFFNMISDETPSPILCWYYDFDWPVWRESSSFRGCCDPAKNYSTSYYIHQQQKRVNYQYHISQAPKTKQITSLRFVCLFCEILEVFLAWFLLHQRKGLRKLTHVHRWFASIHWKRGDVSIWTNNWVIQYHRIIAHHNSLPQNAVPSNFWITANRHGFDNSTLIYEDIVAFVSSKLPIVTGTYLSSLFWRFVGGLITTI